MLPDKSKLIALALAGLLQIFANDLSAAQNQSNTTAEQPQYFVTEDNNLRIFILYNYDNVAHELLTEPGEYYAALLEIARLAESSDEIEAQKLRGELLGLLLDTEGAFEFASAVIERAEQ